MSVREDILLNLETALNGIKLSPDYESLIKEVSRYDENVLMTENFSNPLVMIVDVGDDEKRVQDITDYRFRMTVVLRGFVKAGNQIQCQTELNKLVSTIRKFINAGVALGSNVLDFRFMNNEQHRYDQDKGLADCVINTRISYWCANGSF